MDSPAAFQSPSSHPSRSRAPNTLSRPRTTSHTVAVDSRGAIQKRSRQNDRTRSISLSQDRLFRLATEQSNVQYISSTTSIPDPSLGLQLQWITPQHSPQPQGFSEPVIEAFPQWSVPTPPRSDSGIPNVVDSDDSSTCIGTSAGFDHFQPATSAEEMSSLGYLLPSQYGASPYDSEQSSNYAAMEQTSIPPMRTSQTATTSAPAAYAPGASTSPALHQYNRHPDAARRYPDSPSSYEQNYRAAATSNPYDMRSSTNYSVASGPTIPPIGGMPLGSPTASQMSHYTSGHLPPRPTAYDNSPAYSHSSSYTTAPPAHSAYGMSSQSYPGPSYSGSSASEIAHQKTPSVDASSIRVLNQRPKPQCWDHGCNGRQFSTFSNLLRHQREKSGTAAKSYCPRCGAEFTRTTARNGHLAHDKCTKQRQDSDAK